MVTVAEILETKGRAVHTTRPDATVVSAVDDMCRLHIGALLVTEGKSPVGIVSERDIMARLVLKRRDPATTRVDEIMTREVVCTNLETSPEEAMAIMTQRRCRHLPVMLEGNVVGVLSIGDLVRWVSRHQEYEIRMLEDYVSGRYPG
jgi:CBS domain-containing protein